MAWFNFGKWQLSTSGISKLSQFFRVTQCSFSERLKPWRWRRLRFTSKQKSCRRGTSACEEAKGCWHLADSFLATSQGLKYRGGQSFRKVPRLPCCAACFRATPDFCPRQPLRCEPSQPRVASGVLPKPVRNQSILAGRQSARWPFSRAAGWWVVKGRAGYSQDGGDPPRRDGRFKSNPIVASCTFSPCPASLLYGCHNGNPASGLIGEDLHVC